MANKKIKVYGTPTCPYCAMTRKFLQDNNIEFEYIDVSAEPEKVREIVEKSGQMGVPVLDIDGRIVTGFDKDAIERALGL